MLRWQRVIEARMKDKSTWRNALTSERNRQETSRRHQTSRQQSTKWAEFTCVIESNFHLKADQERTWLPFFFVLLPATPSLMHNNSCVKDGCMCVKPVTVPRESNRRLISHSALLLITSQTWQHTSNLCAAQTRSSSSFCNVVQVPFLVLILRFIGMILPLKMN